MHYITSNYFSDKEYLLKVDGSWMQRVVDGQVVDIDINMSDVWHYESCAPCIATFLRPEYATCCISDIKVKEQTVENLIRYAVFCCVAITIRWN